MSNVEKCIECQRETSEICGERHCDSFFCKKCLIFFYNGNKGHSYDCAIEKEARYFKTTWTQLITELEKDINKSEE